jgi:elongation factor Ts
LVSYVHGGGRIGVLVKFDTDLAGKDAFREYAKDIDMQIAALNPLYVRREDIPAEVVEQEKEILKAQIAQDEKMKNKPEAVIEKMIVGRLNKKLFQESCLVEQAFVKDGELTVGQYTEKTAKELGGKIAIVSFERYEKGEGIEKRECDFASEVAGMIK